MAETKKAKPKTIAAKLLEIRKEVLYLKKATTGGSGKFTYQYVAGVDVLAAIKPKMDELGLLLIPKIVQARTTVVHAKRWNKYEQREVPDTQYLVDMDMLMVWVDVESGETMEVPFFAMANMDDAAKSVGSALTYTERYFICKFFQVETDELDPDAYRRKKGESASPSQDDLEAAGKTAIKSLSADTLKVLLGMLEAHTAQAQVVNWVNKYKKLFTTSLHPEHQRELGAAIASRKGQIEAGKVMKSPPRDEGPPPDEEPPPPEEEHPPERSGPADEPPDGFPF